MVNDKQLLEAIADMWSKVGIRAKVEMMEMGARQKHDQRPHDAAQRAAARQPAVDAARRRRQRCGASSIRTASAASTGRAASPASASTTSWSRRATRSTRRSGSELYREATQIVHEEKPWLELFQEVIVYGVSKRVTFKPRADYRLIVAEMTLAR